MRKHPPALLIAITVLISFISSCGDDTDGAASTSDPPAKSLTSGGLEAPTVDLVDLGLPPRDSDGAGWWTIVSDEPEVTPTPVPVVIEEINLDADVLFESGSADLGPIAGRALSEALDALQNNPHAVATIHGHTDSVGQPDFNLGLAKRRAEAVAALLMDAGISSDRLETVGWGSADPIGDNETEEGRRQNRRVVVSVTTAGA